MDKENPIDDTNVEEQEQVAETTEPESAETVENFSDKLDVAETEEEALAVFKEEKTPEETLEEPEEPEVETIDTEPTYISHLKDGEIELDLNYNDPKERKQLDMLAQQGLNYAGKTTELAKHKSFVNYAEENGISLEDIQMLKDIKSGNKEAFSKLGKNAEIDLYDVEDDMHEGYKPEPVELPPVVDPAINIIADEILQNADNAAAFQKWFPTMPENIRHEIESNPQVLGGVRDDMDAGVFDAAMQQAYKYQRVEGMDFASAYVKAKGEIQAINPQSDPDPVTRDTRVRASAPRSGGGTPRSTGVASGAITDMNDEDFLANYRDIVNQVQNNR